MSDTKSFPHVKIKESPIHGKGLFADQDIKSGEVIGVVNGKPTDIDGSHVLWVDGIDGFEVTCDLRYINHSDSPNACYYDTLEVSAIRDIVVGEEITHNYGGDS